jgi:hypothetical protein
MTANLAGASPVDQPVGRLVPKRAGLADKIAQACALHALVLTLGTKPGSERSAKHERRDTAGRCWASPRTDSSASLVNEATKGREP